MGLVLGLLVCLQLANSQDVDPGRTTGLLAHEQLLLPHPGPLPQGEGEPLTVLQNAVSAGPLNVGTTVLPLPGGEGRSEGELGAGGSSPLVPTKASLAFDSLAELRADSFNPRLQPGHGSIGSGSMATSPMRVSLPIWKLCNALVSVARFF